MGVFPHQKLIVYGKALECCAALYAWAHRLPREHWRLRDQIERASTSILLNLAEGAGEFSPHDKARFYRMARRSAAEVSAALDLALRVNLISAPAHAVNQRRLEELAAILTRMVKVMSARARSAAAKPARSRRHARRPPSASPSPSPSPES